MSKREAIGRYHIIINKVRTCPASFEEILDSLKIASEVQSYNLVVSFRTFQRDLNDIRSLYGIDIKNDKRNRVYYIDHQESSAINERILEAYDTFNALSLSDRIAEHIHFETRSTLGTEHLFGLLHAIKNRFQVGFGYQSYSTGMMSVRRVESYFLKEYKGRWYLICVDCKDKQIKSFALDMIADLEITKTPFGIVKPDEIDHYYKHSFGIVGPNKEALPEQVVLRFTSHQGKYIKTLPLHNSQRILNEDESSVTVQIKIHITHDFLMEILGHGLGVKVLSPVSLVEEIKRIYLESFEQY